MSAQRITAQRRPRPRGWWVPYVIIAPAAIMELVIHVIPMVTGFVISLLNLTRYHIRDWSSAPFAGLANFITALNISTPIGQGVLHSFGLSLAYTVCVVTLAWTFGMVAATVLQRPFRGRALWRTLFLVPYALPMYAGVITWNFMLQRDSGLVNHVLVDQLGLMGDRPFWLIGDNAFLSLVIVAVWRNWPFAFLMLMAGLQSIPADVYEAAAIDGASSWQQWRRITLPMLAPVNRVLLLVMSLWVFNDFNTPFVLFGDGQPASGDLISFHIYNASFLTWDFGLGSAMSVTLLLVLLAASLIYMRATSPKENRHA
ncbi:MAG: sugar ABC transporter permease [Propionibacteriaceae bacterium]|nr:sugar ABC transporter permease [Propionibacteriaceae bacterium]